MGEEPARMMKLLTEKRVQPYTMGSESPIHARIEDAARRIGQKDSL
jgi:hypothetical protein